jgi:hypothetical protein
MTPERLCPQEPVRYSVRGLSEIAKELAMPGFGGNSNKYMGKIPGASSTGPKPAPKPALKLPTKPTNLKLPANKPMLGKAIVAAIKQPMRGAGSDPMSGNLSHTANTSFADKVRGGFKAVQMANKNGAKIPTRISQLLPRNAGKPAAAASANQYAKTPNAVPGNEYAKTPNAVPGNEYGKTPNGVRGNEYGKTPKGVKSDKKKK